MTGSGGWWSGFDRDVGVRAVLDAVPDGVFIADDAGKLVYLNEGACRQLGRSHAELLGSPVSRFVARQDFDFDRVRDQVRTNAHARISTAHVRADGHIIPIELTLLNIQLEGRTFILGIARDLTAQRDADEKVARSEYRYRSLVENLPGSVAIMFDPSLRFVLVDGPELLATGFSKQSMEGRLLREALPTEFADAVEPNMLRVLAGERFSADIPFGESTYHYEYVPLRTSGGGVEFGLILGQNVTATVRAQLALADRERQFRTLAENLPDLVVRFDRDARVLYANRQLQLAMGLDADAAVGRPLADLGQPPHVVEGWQPAIERVLASGTPSAREDMLTGSRGPRLWATRLVPEVTDGDPSAITSVLVLSRDITDERRAEEERQLFEVKVRQAGKLDALGRLAGGVAHDFNNLLTAIHSYAHLIGRNTNLEARSRQDLEEIQRATERGSALTTQLLAFSRGHVGEVTYLELDDLVSQTIRMLMRLVGEDIDISFAPTSRAVVRVQQGHIEQVLMNLATNARDAMPQGGTIEIETSTVELTSDALPRAVGAHAGRFARLRVRDSGTGMQPETLEHLFEPFFTTKEVGKGTGLGLSIVFGITNKSGGFVDVQSTLDVGSTFDIYLPVQDRPARTVTPASATHVPASAAHILLVEDETPVLQATARLLRTRGYIVHIANRPDEALRIAEEPDLRLDLVVTDVIMPGLNGPRMVEKLRIRRPSLPVLYMSGYTDDQLANAGLSERDQFLQKPFVVTALIEKISEMLGERMSKAL